MAVPGGTLVQLRRRPRVGRWRVAVLLGVHVAIALHVTHFLAVGRSLAPLELNEVLYTLHAGIVTAGFVFMALAALGTLLFGRFFCGWGCHLLALQDLTAHLGSKLGLRARAPRSLALLAIAPAATFYLFVWPELERWLSGRPRPPLVIQGDGQGWASFVTQDFARNLPGPAIALFTFAVCGVLMVLLLGSRSFCRYACPYGALFRVMDRLAPLRIALRGTCTDCGACSRVCTSHVDVHREIRAHGRIVDPHCLRDLDCVSVCPTGALRLARDRPAWLEPSARSAERDLRLGEEVGVGLVVAGVVLVYRGLYDAVPLLCALGLGALGGWAVVLALRLLREASPQLAGWPLRQDGRLTDLGRASVAALGAFALVTAHSALVRAHAFLGERAFLRVSAASEAEQPIPAADLADAALHLHAAEALGLVVPVELEARLFSVALLAGERDEALARGRRVVTAAPGDLVARAHFARALVDRDPAEAARQAEAVLGTSAIAPEARAAQALACEVLADLALHRGDADLARQALEEALDRAPGRIASARRLASLLVRSGEPERARSLLAGAAERAPRSARIHDELGVVLGVLGEQQAALAEHRRAVALDPGDALARTNLGVSLANAGQIVLARAELSRALDLDPQDGTAREALAAIGGRDGP